MGKPIKRYCEVRVLSPDWNGLTRLGLFEEGCDALFGDVAASNEEELRQKAKEFAYRKGCELVELLVGQRDGVLRIARR